MSAKTFGSRCPVNHRRSALFRRQSRKGRPMSQRRSRAVRWQANARRTISMVAARPAGVLLQLSDAPFLDEDSRDTSIGEEDCLEPAWLNADVAENVVEVLITEELSRLEPRAVVDNDDTAGTERLILLYLQEAGSVRLLTA